MASKRAALPAGTADGVDLINEDDARRVLASLAEQVAYLCGVGGEERRFLVLAENVAFCRNRQKDKESDALPQHTEKDAPKTDTGAGFHYDGRLHFG